MDQKNICIWTFLTQYYLRYFSHFYQSFSVFSPWFSFPLSFFLSSFFEFLLFSMMDYPKKQDSWCSFKDWPYGLQIRWNTRQTWKNGWNTSRKGIKTNKDILKLLILWYQWGKRYFQISSLKFYPLLQASFHFLRQSRF